MTLRWPDPNQVPVPSGLDHGCVWHYGDPLREQRYLERPGARVHLSSREVVQISGSFRQAFSTLILDDLGYIAHHLEVVDDGESLLGWTEPGRGASLVDHLTKGRGHLDSEVRLRPDIAVVWASEDPGGLLIRAGAPGCLGGVECFVARAQIDQVMASGIPVGIWAFEARRISVGIPRFFLDTDDHTLPSEVGILGPAGESQTPPRRLVRLHLDGSTEPWMSPGGVIRDRSGVVLGAMGSMAYHVEQGPIGLGLVQATTPEGEVWVDHTPATLKFLAELKATG